MAYGYVYVARTASHPEVLKIGRSVDPEGRMKSLSSCNLTEPYKLLLKARSMNPARDEKKAHDYFKRFRVKGEFFAVEFEKVKEFLMLSIDAGFDDECKRVESAKQRKYEFDGDSLRKLEGLAYRKQ